MLKFPLIVPEKTEGRLNFPKTTRMVPCFLPFY
jgi:hypothetical protein